MKPSTRRVRDRLRQGPATTAELCQPHIGGVRFSARIEELRKDEGCVIDARILRSGSYLYTLISEPSPAPSSTPGKPVPISATTPPPCPVGASGQVPFSSARCAIFDDDWEDAA